MLFIVLNYIIPIWNWSNFVPFAVFVVATYYIIPIWNWSFSTSVLVSLSFTDYIIPIWNWSVSRSIYEGKDKELHYSYMELERVVIVPSLATFPFITLFLYGIGAEDGSQL